MREVTEVFATVAVEVRDLSQRQSLRCVEQALRRAELSVLLLIQQIRLIRTQHRDIVALVAVEVSRQHDPRERRNLRQTDRGLLGPVAGLRLKANHELVGSAKVREIGQSVVVEIPDRHRSDFVIDAELPMLEPPQRREVIDLDLPRRSVRRFRRALQQQIDPTMSIVGDRQIGDAVVVEVARHQVGRTIREFDQFQRLEAVERRQLVDHILVLSRQHRPTECSGECHHENSTPLANRSHEILLDNAERIDGPFLVRRLGGGSIAIEATRVTRSVSEEMVRGDGYF